MMQFVGYHLTDAGFGSWFRGPRWREFDVWQPPLSFEVDDLAGIGPLEHVTGKLENIAADEEPECEQKDRYRERTEIDRYEKKAENGGRDSDHVKDEADRVGMPLEPVLHQGMWR